MLMEEINRYGRVYRLQPKDIFCVNVEAFLKDSTLWSHRFQIVGTDEYKRKHWWQFWKSRKTRFIKIMYLGDSKNEQN
jgi:hypothetical protein